MIGLIGLSQCGQAAGGTPGSEPTKRRKATKEVLKGKKGEMVQVFAQGGLTQHIDPLVCAFFDAVHRICEQPVWACADLQPRTRTRGRRTSLQLVSEDTYGHAMRLSQA